MLTTERYRRRDGLMLWAQARVHVDRLEADLARESLNRMPLRGVREVRGEWAGFASPALYGSQHPRRDEQEQPGAGGDAVEAAGADAGVIAPAIQRYLDGDVYAATCEAPPAE
jgi:hypothetical protein